jgi:hypothetical protein
MFAPSVFFNSAAIAGSYANIAAMQGANQQRMGLANGAGSLSSESLGPLRALDTSLELGAASAGFQASALQLMEQATRKMIKDNITKPGSTFNTFA